MMMLLRRALARVARPNASRRGLRSSANTGSSASSSSPPSTAAASGANGAGKTAAAGETASSAGSVTTLHSATPGIMRIRKGGGGANGKVVEVDSTIARIMGSDWGDRRNQTVSLPMRIYWLVFGVVLVNGAYTYFAGKDGAFVLVHVVDTHYVLIGTTLICIGLFAHIRGVFGREAAKESGRKARRGRDE